MRESTHCSVDSTPLADRERCLAYVGVISPDRGLFNMLAALGPNRRPPASGRPLFAALFGRSRCKQMPAWKKVDYRGVLDRQGVAALLSQARVGIVTFLPTPGYLPSLPVKLFEYMLAGLPVVASDFPLWREDRRRRKVRNIGRSARPSRHRPGLHVAVRSSGRSAGNGRTRPRGAVLEKYNWTVEAERLLDLLSSDCSLTAAATPKKMSQPGESPGRVIAAKRLLMNVWLLHVGEDLADRRCDRVEFRYGYLATALVRRGHRVTRWAPTFHHFRKVQRAPPTPTLRSIPDTRFVWFMLAAIAEMSVWHAFGRIDSSPTRFDRLADKFPTPDLIVSGIPSLEWCTAAVAFGRRHGVPVVIDIRDLWPDVYLNALPPPFCARLVVGRLAGVYRRTRRMLAGATALAAVSQSYLDWGLAHSGRERSTLDCVIPLGYNSPRVSSAELELRATLADRVRRRPL